MSMTVTESSAVNAFVRWLFQAPTEYSQPTEETPQKVEELWQQHREHLGPNAIERIKALDAREVEGG